jgi:crossover junction endodeoxyribonuclease RuvC
LYIVGIDPGLKGGIAYYHPTKLITYRTPTIEVPFIKKGKKKTRNDMDLENLRDEMRLSDIDHVFLEKVSAMPGQGVTGMFRFGQNLGQWQGLLVALDLPYTMVTPQAWKKHMGLIKADKGKSVDLAREFWPEHQTTSFKYKGADEGRAEASLIAKYGWEQLNAQAA